jgi:exo-beta-1,3-glucanase (GH17 family)
MKRLYLIKHHARSLFRTPLAGVKHHARSLFRTPLAGGICLALLTVPTLCQGSDTRVEEKASSPIQQKSADRLCGATQAICYSGFRSGQHPDRGDGAVNPSDAEVLEDLEILARDGNFNLIRLYDCQENSQAVLRLIKKHDLDMKVLLGAWLDAEVSNPNCWWHPEPYPDEVLAANKIKNAEELQRAIRLAKEYPDIVAAVAVGNEALVSWNDHMVPVEQVITYVRRVKKAVDQPVTVADNFDWWAKDGAALAKEVDFLAIHTYPLWEGIDIDDAMKFCTANVQAVRDAYPDSRLVITEAGWATIASESFFFEAFDESWKGNPDNPMGAEKHWGIFNEDRTAKLVMHDLYPDLKPAEETE